MFIHKYRLMEEEGSDPAPGGVAPEGSAEGSAEGGTPEGGDVKPGNWPDNWRELYAGEDEKKLNRLSRYASPQAAFDAMLAAQNRISEGQLKTPFPADGSDEEKTAWRKENGLPESADKYDLTFDNGLVIGDEDKEFIDDFLKVAHESNYRPEQVKEAVKWFYDFQAKNEEARADADAAIAQEVSDKLHAEWGSEYRAHINRIEGLLDTAPEGLKDQIKAARLPDGTPLFSSEAALKFFVNLAMEVNPATTLVPPGSGNVMSSIDDEIANMESMMANRSSEYWKGPKAEKNQQRYRELVAAKDKLQRKSA